MPQIRILTRTRTPGIVRLIAEAYSERFGVPVAGIARASFVLDAHDWSIAEMEATAKRDDDVSALTIVREQ